MKKGILIAMSLLITGCASSTAIEPEYDSTVEVEQAEQFTEQQTESVQAQEQQTEADNFVSELGEFFGEYQGTSFFNVKSGVLTERTNLVITNKETTDNGSIVTLQNANDKGYYSVNVMMCDDYYPSYVIAIEGSNNASADSQSCLDDLEDLSICGYKITDLTVDNAMAFFTDNGLTVEKSSDGFTAYFVADDQPIVENFKFYDWGDEYQTIISVQRGQG